MSFCKYAGISFVAAKKLILTVSVPPRMAVVPRKNKICAMQISQVRNVQGCTFLTEPAVNFFSRLGSTSPICKRLTEKGCLTRVSPLLKTVLNVSVPPRMAVVPRKNEICAMQISQVRNVQGCTFLTEPAVNLCSRLVVSERGCPKTSVFGQFP